MRACVCVCVCVRARVYECICERCLSHYLGTVYVQINFGDDRWSRVALQSLHSLSARQLTVKINCTRAAVLVLQPCPTKRLDILLE